MPEAANLKTEPEHIRKPRRGRRGPASGRLCRELHFGPTLVERGVRFVQLFNGAYTSGGRINWDGHFKLKEQYDVHGRILDQPSPACCAI